MAASSCVVGDGELLEAAFTAAGDVLPCGGSSMTELTGGLSTGEVTEVFGMAGCGKTQVREGAAPQTRRAQHHMPSLAGVPGLGCVSCIAA